MDGLVTFDPNIDEYNLSERSNVFHWKIHVFDMFSVKYMYADLVKINHLFRKKFICKLKSPAKDQMFCLVLVPSGSFNERQFGGTHVAR